MASFDDVGLMNAVVCHVHGWPQPLAIGPMPVPQPGTGELLVAVAAAGVNFADMLVIGGGYQEKLTPPFIPGAELSGRVVATGRDVVGFDVGDRIMAQVSSGAYAEYVCVDPARAAHVPDTMSDAEAAGFYIPYGTAYAGLMDRARLTAGDVVVITGAGGAVGRAAVEVAKAAGATVVAIAAGDERQALVREAGADHVVGGPEAVLEATGGRAVDIVFDMVGGADARALMRCLAFEGRMVLVGFAGGEVPVFPANHVLVKNIDICGFFWGPYQHKRREETARVFTALAELYTSGRLRPRVAAVFPLDRTGDALAAIVQRTHVGKLVVQLDQAPAIEGGSAE